MASPNLENQIALITGAGRGIGKVIALGLAHHGAHVVLVARSKNEIDDVAASIQRDGHQATAIVADLADEAQIVACFARVEKELGRLDMLINNAGIGHFGPIDTFTGQQWDEVFAVNARAAFLCSREALRIMKARGRGYLINIGSVVAFKGYASQAAYGASKHALLGFTKALAMELQNTPIRVSAILPGGVATEMIAHARPDLDPATLLDPEDVTEAILYLLSLSERVAVDQIYIRRRYSTPF